MFFNLKTNFNFKLKFVIYFLATLISIHCVYSQDSQLLSGPEKIVKKSKVIACTALTKARLTEDQGMINEFVDKINGYYKVTDGRSKIISLCLVSCYNKITPEKALDIISAMHNRQAIDSKTQEHKNLIGLDDDADPTGEITKEDFARDFAEINSILREMNLENENINTEAANKDKNKKKPSKNEIPQKEKIKEDEKVSFFGMMLNNLVSLVSFLLAQSDYVAIGLLIVFLYICLSVLRKLFTKNQNVLKAKTQAAKENQEKKEEKIEDKKIN